MSFRLCWILVSSKMLLKNFECDIARMDLVPTALPFVVGGTVACATIAVGVWQRHRIVGFWNGESLEKILQRKNENEVKLAFVDFMILKSAKGDIPLNMDQNFDVNKKRDQLMQEHNLSQKYGSDSK